ncbi:netrin-4 [Erpetoichthys calabaricus]|uniref:netrin-4 n=1 Tax=Erpetoichthys calabaricus TaxID=27687 RepID=UPI0022345E79|nr:netrin-4 [Erpetoichthys calabaricus]
MQMLTGYLGFLLTSSALLLLSMPLNRNAMFRQIVIPLTALLGFSSVSSGLSSMSVGVAHRCENHACNPRMGNLAFGRRLLTQSTCGLNSTDLFCAFSDNADGSCRPYKCDKCNAAHPNYAHHSAAMADSSFRFPHTWWQSAEGVQRETIQLNLETKFYFTHMIMVFKSPRPAAMLLEKSHDFGRSWTPCKYYSTNCSETFGLEDDTVIERAMCTSKYSGAFPCTRGEVIYRALPPLHSEVDPYSPVAQEKLMVTNLRVQLLKRQQCPCQSKEVDIKPQHLAHYAVYDFVVKGSCFCNGHAEQCISANGYHPIKEKSQHVIHGKCICKHNTAGDHCQLCAPLYNDQPWQPANGITGAPNECKKCKCNGHAESCHFDMTLWLTSGNHSGGVCDNCQHNTEGVHCQKCRMGFYRDLHKPFSAPDSCKPCGCHPIGSLPFNDSIVSFCDPNNGDCICKPGIGGPHCDRCMVGYWGFSDYGCRPCDCAGSCDPYTGDCISSATALDWYYKPDFISSLNETEPVWDWEDEQGFSALRHSGKCECKEQILGNPKLFCAMKYAYVLKVKILSAHDKGSHAEVNVKVKKVLLPTKMKIAHEKITLYPESWTTRGCTCPILNPGMEYLVAGHEDSKKKRLIVNMKSFVKPWKRDLGRKVVQFLKTDCRW